MNKRTLVIAVVVVGLGGGGAYLATRGGPPPAPTDDASAAPDAQAPPEPPPERVVTAVEQTWQEQAPSPPEHGHGPITDEAWVDHPCHRYVSVALDPKVSEADKRALVERILADHSRNKTLDVDTWTYAACVAVERDDVAPCLSIGAVGDVVQMCVDLFASVQLAEHQGTVEDCERWFATVASKPLREDVRRHLCRAQHQEPTACDAFPQPIYGWVCHAHLEADAAHCAGVADVHSRAECLALVDLVRATRALPPQTGDALDPGMPMTLMFRKVADPTLDCGAWFAGRLRESCY